MASLKCSCRLLSYSLLRASRTSQPLFCSRKLAISVNDILDSSSAAPSRPLVVQPLMRPGAVLRPVHSTMKTLEENVKLGRCHTSTVGADVRKLIDQMSRLADSQVAVGDVNLLMHDERWEALQPVMFQESLQARLISLIAIIGRVLPLDQTDVTFTKMLLEILLDRLRFVSIGQLSEVVKMLSEYGNTELRRRILNNALRDLELRWVEIHDAKDVVSLMYCVPMTGFDKVLQRLEDKALELTSQMSVKHLYRIAYILSRRQRRNMPLLHAISHYLNKYELHLGPIHLSNLLFALASLNVFDVSLLTKITGLLAASLPTMDAASFLPSLFHSLVLLRLRDTALLDTIADFVFEKDSSAANIVGLLQTCSHVSYVPLRLMSRPGALAEVLSQFESLKSENPRVWLDLVWSSALLGNINAVAIGQVLADKFALSVAGSESFSRERLCLMNLNAIALHKCPDLRGQLLTQQLSTYHQLPIRQSKPLLDSIKESLEAMIPKSADYCQFNVPTPFGCVIDVEMLVDSKGKPRRLENFKADFSGNKKALSLPKGTHRLAVLVLDFGEMTIPVVQPTGLVSSFIDYLVCEGYQVMQIPYTELDGLKQPADRVTYLETKLKSSVVLKPKKATTRKR